MKNLMDAKITSLLGSWDLMLDAMARMGIDIDLEGGQVVESDGPFGSIRQVSEDIFVVDDDTSWSYIRIDNPEDSAVKAVYHATIDARPEDWVDVYVRDMASGEEESFRLQGGLSAYNPNPGGWVRLGMQPLRWSR